MKRLLTAMMALVPNSRGVERGSLGKATCEWNGRSFEAVSRSGASYALCRELVSAGCPDMPMEVLGENGKAQLSVRSIHRAAGVTIEESANKPIHAGRYRPLPQEMAAACCGEAQNRGVFAF